MIQLENVSKYYGTTRAVDNLSMTVGRGEVCVLIGPSGCGKTTVLRMINRLIEPSAGKIFIDGREASKTNPESLRRGIGYAIQNVGLFPHMTVAQNISVVPALLHWPKQKITARVMELLDLVGLAPAEHAGKYPRELSGGEAQRIGVARALAADPPILLMDEPFGAVDPLMREKLQGQFQSIQRRLKKTVIFVTHDLDEGIRLADRIAVMRSGKLIQFDTPESILARPADSFVHDFVGVDRALKRLARINVMDYIRSSPTITLETSLGDALRAADSLFSIWVTDPDGRLVGWATRTRLKQVTSLREAVVFPQIEDFLLGPNASLRQALSIMLGQGLRSVPVADENQKFVGEVTLKDVEIATLNQEESDNEQKA